MKPAAEEVARVAADSLDLRHSFACIALLGHMREMSWRICHRCSVERVMRAVVEKERECVPKEK